MIILSLQNHREKILFVVYCIVIIIKEIFFLLFFFLSFFFFLFLFLFSLEKIASLITPPYSRSTSIAIFLLHWSREILFIRIYTLQGWAFEYPVKSFIKYSRNLISSRAASAATQFAEQLTPRKLIWAWEGCVYLFPVYGGREGKKGFSSKFFIENPRSFSRSGYLHLYCSNKSEMWTVKFAQGNQMMSWKILKISYH